MQKKKTNPVLGVLFVILVLFLGGPFGLIALLIAGSALKNMPEEKRKKISEKFLPPELLKKIETQKQGAKTKPTPQKAPTSPINSQGSQMRHTPPSPTTNQGGGFIGKLFLILILIAISVGLFVWKNNLS